MGPEDKKGAVVCGVPDAPKLVPGPKDKMGVVAREAPDASKPTTGPEDIKGEEDCGAAGKDDRGLPGTFVGLSFPMGCIFVDSIQLMTGMT